MIQFEAFWVVMPCSFVVGYHRLGGLSFLHFHPLHGITTQKAVK